MLFSLDLFSKLSALIVLQTFLVHQKNFQLPNFGEVGKHWRSSKQVLETAGKNVSKWDIDVREM